MGAGSTAPQEDPDQPCRGFNWPHPDHFRLVALPEESVLREAVGRIAEYCEETRVID
jgi:aspartate/methionine/tyrosine aminotransferase